MNSYCPHCIIENIAKKANKKGIVLSDDFKVGFQLGAIFYPELTRKRKKA